MNKRTLTGGLLAVILVALSAACSSPGPATNTTNTAATSNAANRAATPASSPAATNANNANAAGGAADATGAQDFTLVNKTGVEIHALHVSPHGSDDWEEDVLGKDTLADGATLDIKFDRDEKSALWDLRIEDKDGNHIEWENLDLLKISKVTLFYKDGKGTAQVE